MGNHFDSLLEKAKFLSELEPGNVLSIHLAANEIAKANYSEAEKILVKILENFPECGAAKIMLCKTYAHLEKYQLAIQTLRSASEQIHSPKTFDYYFKEIENIQQNDRVRFNTSEAADLKISRTVSKQEEIKEIDAAKSYDNLLVSETLAKIYIAQGEIHEAIKIYERLIERKPENKEKYYQSINELKSRLPN
jgi:predicted Zn-dependent protease